MLFHQRLFIPHSTNSTRPSSLVRNVVYSFGATPSLLSFARFSARIGCDDKRNHSNYNDVYNANDDSEDMVDTLIIGGGPIGLSTAFHLATNYRNNDGSSIVVLERDPTYSRSSATLSAGGIRQQFSLKENIAMSLYGREFLRQAHNLLQVNTNDDDDTDEVVDVQFQEHGYLFLASSVLGQEQLIQNNATQKSVGCTDIHLMDPNQLKNKFPWLHTSDILMGSYGERGEGWFDPWALIYGWKRKCRSLGVKFVKGYPIASEIDGESKRVVLSVDVQKEECGRVIRYHVQNIVNAAGAYCNDVLQTLAGINHPNGNGWLHHPLPVEPRKRCIFFFHCNTEQPQCIVPQVAPLTICPIDGVYFRSEGLIRSDGVPTGNFLCGVSPSRDVDRAIDNVDELEYVDHDLWENVIWPALAHRVPAFGEVKVKSSWAGLYEYNTLDQNAIIGYHPEMENVLLANGFSGHGLQQSPAAGRAVAELLSCNGRFETLDLSVFSFDRLIENRPLFEAGIV